MKNEIRVAAAVAVDAMLTAIPGLVPVRVGKKDGYAVDTGVKDENGNPVYAVIDATIKNTEATKTTPAFDLDAAIAERKANDSKPVKEKKTAEPDPEKEARAAKRDAQKDIVLAWCVANLTDEGMSTTDIKAQIPELDGVTIMQVGTYLKAIATENPGIVKREVVNNKPLYFRA